MANISLYHTPDVWVRDEPMESRGCRIGTDRFGVECRTVESAGDIVVPAFGESSRHCVLQADLLLFSCAGAHPSLQRICPCRDYMKGQVALCKDCL
ncbi:alpha-1,6-mannosylglycoprotein 6-beta-N-acetylglucosaminyltransferase A [Tachysurus ichikawai]